MQHTTVLSIGSEEERAVEVAVRGEAPKKLAVAPASSAARLCCGCGIWIERRRLQTSIDILERISVPLSSHKDLVPGVRAVATRVGFSDTLEFVLVASDGIASCWGSHMSVEQFVHMNAAAH